MSLIDLDQMFDLDMALTTPSTTLDDSGSRDDPTNTMKLSESNDSIHDHRFELPTVVTATGVCTVCMEAFQRGTGTGQQVQVPCGHVFHANCIDKWLYVQNSCPLCRFSVFSAGQGSSTASS